MERRVAEASGIFIGGFRLSIRKLRCFLRDRDATAPTVLVRDGGREQIVAVSGGLFLIFAQALAPRGGRIRFSLRQSAMPCSAAKRPAPSGDDVSAVLSKNLANELDCAGAPLSSYSAAAQRGVIHAVKASSWTLPLRSRKAAATLVSKVSSPRVKRLLLRRHRELSHKVKHPAEAALRTPFRWACRACRRGMAQALLWTRMIGLVGKSSLWVGKSGIV